MTAITIPFSAACERNKDSIQEALKPYLELVDTVLEVGSGTGQHAVHFAQAFPHLKWQTSDQNEYLAGVRAQLEHANVLNALLPIELNVRQQKWADTARFSAVYTANTFHIMSSAEVEAFFISLPSVCMPQAYLMVYGPFKYAGKFTSESNRDFDQSLRSRNCGSAIRDFEWVNSLANKSGFNLLLDQKMPANNQCIIWQSRVE